MIRGADSGAPPTARPLVMSHNGLGPLRLCASFRAVDSAFSGKDTVFESEEERWRGKVARYGGGTLTFESSWVDSTRVWRITASSPDVLTERGYHVGMTVRDLLAAKESLTVEMPEGIVFLLLESEGIGLALDTASQAQFVRRVDPGSASRIQIMSPDARIIEMTTSADCSSRGPS